MASIGQDLLRESKKSLKESGEKGENWNSRDLLSLLVKSNMSGDPSQRMSDEDVLARKFQVTFTALAIDTIDTNNWIIQRSQHSLWLGTKLPQQVSSLFSRCT